MLGSSGVEVRGLEPTSQRRVTRSWWQCVEEEALDQTFLEEQVCARSAE